MLIQYSITYQEKMDEAANMLGSPLIIIHPYSSSSLAVFLETGGGLIYIYQLSGTFVCPSTAGCSSCHPGY